MRVVGIVARGAALVLTGCAASPEDFNAGGGIEGALGMYAASASTGLYHFHITMT
jgi:hypothetical protein